MPRLFPTPLPAAPTTLSTSAELTRVLQTWRRPSRAGDEEVEAEMAGVAAVAVVAASRREHAGTGDPAEFLAVVDWGNGPTLITGDSREISAAPARVLAAARACTAHDTSFSSARVARVRQRILDWCASRRALAPLRNSAQDSPLRQQLLRRIDRITRRAPRHLRVRYVDLARAARRAATVTLSAGAEVTLSNLSTSDLPDAEWLHAVDTFVDSYGRNAESSGVRVSALLLLVLSVLPASAGPP